MLITIRSVKGALKIIATLGIYLFPEIFHRVNDLL